MVTQAEALEGGSMMRFAILSDIHANAPAFNVVLTDIQSQSRKVDQILCLGDIVGYGPTPADVLKRAHARIHHFVLGNHDAVVAGRMSPDCFNARAKAAIEWTGRQLDDKARTFFRELPYVLEGPGFRCTHGHPASPTQFRYIIEPKDALDAWAACSEQLIFVGHSHVPGLWVIGASGRPHWLEPTDFSLEDGKRYIVNVGSVGQPRADDVRACYCIYDQNAHSVLFRRVVFDVEAYRTQLADSDIPAKHTHFLNVVDDQTPVPLRESLDFSPPHNAPAGSENVAVARLEGAVRTARRWRLGAALLASCVVVGCCLAVALWPEPPVPMLTVEAREPINPRHPLPVLKENALSAPEVRDLITPDNPLLRWTVRVSDPARQHIKTALRSVPKEKRGEYPVFAITSDAPLPIKLHSELVPAKKGMVLQVAAGFRSEAPLDGHLKLVLEQVTEGKTAPLVEHVIRCDKPDAWQNRSKTAPSLRADGLVRWTLIGEFAGELLVRDCGLNRTQ